MVSSSRSLGKALEIKQVKDLTDIGFTQAQRLGVTIACSLAVSVFGAGFT